MKITYSSNNSGGSWWLTEKDWLALENAGWAVDWRNFLGAKATSASKEFDTMKEALQEFEKLTGQDVSDEGCNCCGPPHCFYGCNGDEQVSCSGEECLHYLYSQVPNSLRDACE